MNPRVLLKISPHESYLDNPPSGLGSVYKKMDNESRHENRGDIFGSFLQSMTG